MVWVGWLSQEFNGVFPKTTEDGREYGRINKLKDTAIVSSVFPYYIICVIYGCKHGGNRTTVYCPSISVVCVIYPNP